MNIVRHKTNQQATAYHTAKMFNQSWNGNPAKEPIFNMTMNDYYEKYLKPELEIECIRIPIKQWYAMMYEKETKMTRKEAIEKFRDVYRGPYADQFVSGLEALGLIKFDEEIGPFDNIQRSKLFEFYHPVTDEIKDGYLTTNACKALIDVLDKYGYKIVKK